MAYLAVNKGGKEYIFNEKPYRDDYYNIWNNWKEEQIKLPKGSIEKLIGRKLTWKDEPVKI